MNKHERAEIFDGLIEDLERWDWTDDFELSEQEGEAIMYLLSRWRTRREYFKSKYAANREERIEESKRRYQRKKLREAMYDKL